MARSTKLSSIIELAKNAKSIAIFAHVNYDHDCLGSMYGLYHFLKRLGKRVEIFLDDTITQIDAKLFDPSLLSHEPKQYDLLISVDCASTKRLGKFAPFFLENKSKAVRLDHHKGLNHDVKIEFVCDKLASCSELILNFIEAMGKKPNKVEATYLYAGLMSDSGNLSYTNCTLETYKSATKLIEYGADNVKVCEILRSISLPAKKIESRMIEKLEVFDNDIAISSLTIKDFKSYGATDGECKNYASKLLDIDGINISCLIKQKSLRSFTVSLRSRKGHNVHSVANLLGGGGHVNAAGSVMSGNEKQVKQAVISAIREVRCKRAE